MKVIIAASAVAIAAGIWAHHDVTSLNGIAMTAIAVLPNVTIIFLAMTVQELRRGKKS